MNLKTITDLKKEFKKAKITVSKLEKYFYSEEDHSNSYISLIAKKLNLSLEKITVTLDKIPTYEYKSQQGKFEIWYDKREHLGSFSLVCLPGCCGILVSTNAYVAAKYRQKGIGRILNEMRISIAYLWGYSCLLCTDIVNNHVQQKILNKNNWQEIYKFINTRTSNNVAIHVVETKKPVISLGFDLPDKCGVDDLERAFQEI